MILPWKLMILRSSPIDGFRFGAPGLHLCGHRVRHAATVTGNEYSVLGLLVLNVGNGWESGTGIMIDIDSYCGSFPKIPYVSHQ